MTFSADDDIGNALVTLHLVSCTYHTPLNLVFQDLYAKIVKITTANLYSKSKLNRGNGIYIRCVTATE